MTEVSLDGAAANLIETEKTVLGALLLLAGNDFETGRLLARLDIDDFWRPSHQTVFETIRDLHRAGAATDPQAVLDALLHAGELNRIGGGNTLHNLIASCSTVANADYHADRLRDVRRRRLLAQTSIRMKQRLDGGTPVDEVWLAAQSESIGWIVLAQSETTLLADALSEVLAEIENPERAGMVQTGFPALDDQLDGGIRPGELVIIGGRPGSGKTVLGLDVVRHCTFSEGRPALFITAEMSQAQLIKRVISAHAAVPHRHLVEGGNEGEGGAMTASDWSRIADAMKSLSAAPLLIADNTQQATLGKVDATITEAKQKHPDLALAVVDFLQLFGMGGRIESRQIEVAAVARGLKNLAGRLQIPIIALCQVNRSPEQRQDKRPGMADLRESGEIEQAADRILFVYRDDYHNPQTANAGEVEFIVAKNRHGATGTVHATSRLTLARFQP